MTERNKNFIELHCLECGFYYEKTEYCLALHTFLCDIEIEENCLNY